MLGGEPMEPQNRETVLALLRKVKAAYPGKDIWCYTGYDYEKDLLRWEREEQERRENRDEAKRKCPEGAAAESAGAEQSVGGESVVTELLGLIDVLVDGEFVEEKRISGWRSEVPKINVSLM